MSRAPPSRHVVAALALAVPALAGCDGPQSALAPAARSAELTADLTWVPFIGDGVIWAAVVALALYANLSRLHRVGEDAARLLIVGGGLFTTTVLAALLVYGFALMPRLEAAPSEDAVRIAVSGEQWWWRVRYEVPDRAEPVELANEIRLPVGGDAALALSSPDVIHSLWLPSLSGKIDMIPGRVNELVLQPTEVGTYRGACAEYCGTSHALMNFMAVVMEPEALEAWLPHQAEPADPPEGQLAEHGLRVFLASGCGGCHAIRGTPADGEIGPDMTHVAGRLTIGSGILPTEPDAFARWIAETQEIKPDVHMPSFGMLPEDDLNALAAYLAGLE